MFYPATGTLRRQAVNRQVGLRNFVNKDLVLSGLKLS
jgi:hypothetical protein